MRIGRAVALIAATASLAACRHGVTPLSPPLAAQLSIGDAFLTGPVRALEDGPVLDRRDFAYAIALSSDAGPAGRRIAFTHLDGARDARLELVALELASSAPFVESVRSLWSTPVNPYLHDVEGLAFSPDGQVVVTASRDGVGRFFAADSGAAMGRFASQEPLTQVAFHPNGHYVFFGSARGRLMAVRYPELTFAGEVPAHTDELRGLAVTADGRVFTGGWDRTVAGWDTVERAGAPEIVRLPVKRRAGLALVEAELNGAPVTLNVDARAPYLFLTPSAARAAGLDAGSLPESTTVEGASGTLGVKRARNGRLVLKGLVLEGVDVAVCEPCVPAGAGGVLGAPLFEQAEVTWEDASTLRIAPRQTRRSERVEFDLRFRVTLDGVVNDLTVDRAARHLGVATSPEKAERSQALYEREKKGDFGAVGPASAGLLLNAEDGTVDARFLGHQGVVSTATISPDGATLVTGGWDRTVRLFHIGAREPVDQRTLGGSVRRARISRDGRWIGVAAWTPPRVGDSEPAALLYALRYEADVEVKR